MKIVFTDLDGTLLDNNAKISLKNLDTLNLLKQKDIINVAVTGRNLYSCRKVLARELPIDYLIFSTGIAIMDFRTSEIISKKHFKSTKAREIAEALFFFKKNMFIHKSAPDNHYFYFKSFEHNPEFERRFKLYSEFAIELNDIKSLKNVSQFLMILSTDDNDFFYLKNTVSQKIKEIKIIRATSPINHKNIWFEIYPKNVSKAYAAIELCNLLNVDILDTVSVGNDYNDVDLLEVTGKSYIVENAPEELKNKFENVSSNQNDGFSEAVYRALK